MKKNKKPKFDFINSFGDVFRKTDKLTKAQKANVFIKLVLSWANDHQRPLASMTDWSKAEMDGQFLRISTKTFGYETVQLSLAALYDAVGSGIVTNLMEIESLEIKAVEGNEFSIIFSKRLK